MKIKCCIVLAAIFALMSIALGAWGSHGLKDILSIKQLQWIATGAQYQIYHALALLSVALLALMLGFDRWLQLTAIGFSLGVFLFSGSLYALAFDLGHWWVYVTPLGGLVLMLSWCCLLVAATRLEIVDANS